MNYKRPIWTLCFVAILIATVRFLTLTGLLRSVVISGDSMAEALYGEHLQIVCKRCGYGYCVTATTNSTAVCPRCRHGNALEQGRGVAADNVLIDTAAYWFAQPGRFDCIAFQEPDSARLAVKRIVALPGESWGFQRGDLWVNEQLVRKSPAQFLETAVKLYDTHPLHTANQQRWQIEQGTSNWKWQNNLWMWQANPESPDTNDCLVFRHTAVHPAAQNQRVSLNDEDPFNLGNARQLQNVTDVAYSGRIQLAPNTEIVFHIHDGYRQHTLRYKNPHREKSHTYTFLAGHWDRQLWLVVDQLVIEQRELSWEMEPPKPSHTALGLSGAGEGSLTLEHVQVWRDLHYLDPSGTNDTWGPTAPLKANTYAVLGDNLPVSIDTRHWEHGIFRQQILGKVMLWKRHVSP